MTEIEAYLLEDIEVRERIAKKMKQFNTITAIVDRINYIYGDHWRNFYCSIRQWCWIGRWHFLKWDQATSFSCNCTVKQEKHDSIKLLAQRKLDSIANIISQSMQDRDISPTEFRKVLQEVEKYRKLKADTPFF